MSSSTTAAWLWLGAAIAPLLSMVNGADCTEPNQSFYDKFAVDMMWRLRDEYCNQHWDGNFKLYVDNPDCPKKSGTCYQGWWYGHDHPTQLDCWTLTEQIIDQCMKKKDGKIYNGGTWSYNGQYQEGWFYNVGRPFKRNFKREVETIDARSDVDRFHTLLNGTVVELDAIGFASYDMETGAVVVKEVVTF
ncbi:hypothetical protein yc1106_02188 [Curvularia clavata]|uniref:Uncharacterized protein n=1 Tax=Curvularia clavata TaxID=95742 RepID=A0A9Q8Z4W8_CURCL|nr:hypothetical protein yc1106_02188 [Curvularia clavata]